MSATLEAPAIESMGAGLLDEGVCRVCGCTHYDPCVNEHGDTCAWADVNQTLCTFCKDGDDES